MPLRVALFSDVHGNLSALEAVLAAIACHAPVHLIVAAGDHAIIGPRPAETWDRLQAAGCLCIMGNEDEVLWDTPRELGEGSPYVSIMRARLGPTVLALGERRLAAMQAMPRSLRFSPAAGQGLLIVHANVHGLNGWALSPDLTDADLERLYGGAGAAIVCCGHYHAPSVRPWRGMRIVNVASVSLPKDERPLAAYTILEWAGEWSVTQHRVPYDPAAEDAAWAPYPIPKTPPWS